MLENNVRSMEVFVQHFFFDNLNIKIDALVFFWGGDGVRKNMN